MIYPPLNPTHQAINEASWILNQWFSADLRYHVYTLHLFTCSNLLGIVAMPFLFAILSIAASSVIDIPVRKGPMEIVYQALAMLFWLWSNLLLFSLRNQRHPKSIMEDKINKPWRLFPSNLITSQQNRTMLLALYPVVMLYGGLVGRLKSFLLETIVGYTSRLHFG
jgi:hypothetical protein